MADVTIQTNISELCDSSYRWSGLGSLRLTNAPVDGEVFVAATNGKALAVNSTMGQLPEGQAIAIPQKIAKRGKTKKDKTLKLTNSTWSDGKSIEDAEAGTYPRIADAIPSSAAGYTTVNVDVDLLTNMLLAVAKRGGEDGSRIVKLHIKDNNSPVLADKEDNFGVLMTCGLPDHMLNTDGYQRSVERFKEADAKVEDRTKLQDNAKSE